MVYVISKNGTPLMPTTRYGKVRRMLRDGKAKVVRKEPFTIQLLYDTTTYTQPITLGVDAGSKMVGISATTEKQELYAAELELRNDITKLLADRRQYRRSRRNRLRYRKPRFSNRVSSKKKGWLPPTLENKIHGHLKMIDLVHTILPVIKIRIEVAAFDIQKIQNPDISGEEYQNGVQNNFWNVREYVLWRDNHTCQVCHGKSKDKILNVHHIESRKTGGDSPNNLITLCETCHNKLHDGELKVELKRGKIFRDATHMGIMRWELYNRIKSIYPNVEMTFGYITKQVRIKNNLPKSHRIDALCISGNPNAYQLDYYYYIKQVRKHNRQIHKANILKGGRKKLNQSPYLVKGFRLFDKVKYKGQECFIFGRRSSGYFDLRKLDGTIIHRSASYKKLTLISKVKTFLFDRREWHIHLHPIEDGVSCA